MSHPIPTRDYGDNEYESDSPHKEDGVRPGPTKKKTSFKGEWHEIKKAANKLKRMVDEPAEKAWFVRHGLPKGIRATAKQVAINKKVTQGKEMRRAEDAVHPALHAYKRTLKKKGFSEGERFHRALEFGAKQNPEHKSVKRLDETIAKNIHKPSGYIRRDIGPNNGGMPSYH